MRLITTNFGTKNSVFTGSAGVSERNLAKKTLDSISQMDTFGGNKKTSEVSSHHLASAPKTSSGHRAAQEVTRLCLKYVHEYYSMPFTVDSSLEKKGPLNSLRQQHKLQKSAQEICKVIARLESGTSPGTDPDAPDEQKNKSASLHIRSTEMFDGCVFEVFSHISSREKVSINIPLLVRYKKETITGLEGEVPYLAFKLSQNGATNLMPDRGPKYEDNANELFSRTGIGLFTDPMNPSTMHSQGDIITYRLLIFSGHSVNTSTYGH